MDQRGYLPLLVVALGLVLMPPLLLGIGLTLTSATDVVIFAIACMGLNLLVGYTGLVSFGHGAWFGLGVYAAALIQRHLLPGQLVLPGAARGASRGRLGAGRGLSHPAPARRVLRADDPRADRPALRHRVSLDRIHRR